MFMVAQKYHLKQAFEMSLWMDFGTIRVSGGLFRVVTTPSILNSPRQGDLQAGSSPTAAASAAQGGSEPVCPVLLCWGRDAAGVAAALSQVLQHHPLQGTTLEICFSFFCLRFCHSETTEGKT